MKCKYCKKVCTITTPVYYDGGGFAYDRIQCESCPVKVQFYITIDHKIIDINFLWEEDPDKRFRVFCSIEDNHCLIQFQIYKEEWNIQEIELDFIPDWNPKTIKQKIKTYITFS